MIFAWLKIFPLTGAIGVWPASLPLTKVSFKSIKGFRRGVVRECLGGIFAVLALVGVDTTSWRKKKLLEKNK